MSGSKQSGEEGHSVINLVLRLQLNIRLDGHEGDVGHADATIAVSGEPVFVETVTVSLPTYPALAV